MKKLGILLIVLCAGLFTFSGCGGETADGGDTADSKKTDDGGDMADSKPKTDS